MLNATVQDYRLLQQRIGLTRVVIVTPRNYGTDNSVTVDAIKQLGQQNARGVAVIRPTVTDAELKSLDGAGIRGIRFTVANPQTAVVSIDMIEPPRPSPAAGRESPRLESAPPAQSRACRWPSAPRSKAPVQRIISSSRQ